MKIKLSIKNRWTGNIIFEFEKENNTISETIKEFIRIETQERGKYRADLTDANLTRADLTDADLTRADLTRANLTDADLTDADLTDANLTRANLTYIKNDMFAALLPAISEVGAFRQSIIDGKIDGSTYEGECACLNGTLCRTANPELRSKLIDMRDHNRPIERFFMGIKVGDTPENSQASKLAMEWVDEFMFYINAHVKTVTA